MDWNLGPALRIWLCSISLLSVSCVSTELEKNDQLTNDEYDRVFFSAYKDTLIKVGHLNAALGTDFDETSLGKPIGISETPFWLITVGGWHMNDRNIQVQGSAFRDGNRFYPNPIRRTEVEFSGPFVGIIRFDQKNRTYDWLVRDQGELSFFSYQRTEDFHLLVLNESIRDIQLTEITTGKRIVRKAENDELLDWSLNNVNNALIELIKEGGNPELIVRNSAIKTLLSTHE